MVGRKILFFLTMLLISSVVFAESKVIVTRVNTFKPVVTSRKVKTGFCWVGSVAVRRPDAWRCKVKSEIFDPCFALSNRKAVVCGVDPTKNENGFFLKLTKPLPRHSKRHAKRRQPKINFWLLKLDDDVVCRPYTGTLPLVNIDGKVVAIQYGCHNDIGSEAIGLISGSIIPGEVWRATKITYMPSGSKTKVLKIQKVAIKEAWK